MKILTGAILKILIAMFLLSSAFDTQYELQSKTLIKEKTTKKKARGKQSRKFKRRSRKAEKNPRRRPRPKGAINTREGSHNNGGGASGGPPIVSDSRIQQEAS